MNDDMNESEHVVSDGPDCMYPDKYSNRKAKDSTDRTTPKRAVLKAKLSSIIERYGDQLVSVYIRNTTGLAQRKRTGSPQQSKLDFNDPMYLSKMGTRPSKTCACRNLLECGSHNDVQVGIKSPTNVTDTETHSECGTARSEIGIQRPKNLQRKCNAPTNMIVLCDLCGHTWGSKPWHKSSKPTRYRIACNGTIGRIHDLQPRPYPSYVRTVSPWFLNLNVVRSNPLMEQLYPSLHATVYTS